MKLRSITFDEATEPETLTFTMSVIEANAILGIFGQLNGRAHSRLRFGPDDDVFGGLSSAFCKLYDEGRLFQIPPFDTLNGDVG